MQPRGLSHRYVRAAHVFVLKKEPGSCGEERGSVGVSIMNILFFLKPKAELDLVYEDDTIGMAMERIEDHQFSSIPMINEKTGKYIGTLSEGDLLRTLRKKDNPPFGVENRSVMSVRRKRDYKCVRADADIKELFSYVKEQNFVPVVDDTGVLIGIVLRSTILEFVFGAFPVDSRTTSSAATMRS